MRISPAGIAAAALLATSWLSMVGGAPVIAQEPDAIEQETSPFAEDADQSNEPPMANVLTPPGEVVRPRPLRDEEYYRDRRVKCPTPEELQEWFKPLDRIRVSSRQAEGPLPLDCSTHLFHRADGTGTAPMRNWALTEFHWQASNLAAQPAYWDDVPLERYGQTVHPALQPAISGAKFFCTFPIIPYKIGIDRTHDLIYTLGYYRPGSPTPQVRQRLPWEWDAALFEAGAWVGLVFILP